MDKPHFHISFIMNVSPECDCWNHNDAAIVPDLGMLASADPVALDKACADMVYPSARYCTVTIALPRHTSTTTCVDATNST